VTASLSFGSVQMNASIVANIDMPELTPAIEFSGDRYE